MYMNRASVEITWKLGFPLPNCSCLNGFYVILQVIGAGSHHDNFHLLTRKKSENIQLKIENKSPQHISLRSQSG